MEQKRKARNGGGRRSGQRRQGQSSRGDPVPPVELRTRAEFGAELDRLRTRSAWNLRDLAREISDTSTVPIGFSALGEWCRGDSLPLPSRYEPFRRFLELVGAGDPTPWIEATVRLRAMRGRFASEGRPPYMGLRSFGRDDTEWFFGRTTLVAEAAARFQQVLDDGDRPRMLWVVGPSGAGKSSLLHAGLCSALEAAGHTCVSLTPGPRPAESLAAALVAANRVEIVSGGDAAAASPSEAEAADQVGRLLPAGLVLVVDQFEELFRACDDEVQRQRFLSLLASLTDPKTTGGCAVVVGLRIDFYGPVAAHDQLVPSLQDAQILVGPLNREQLREAIVEPTRQAGVAVDDDLVSALLRDFVPSGSIGGLHDPGSLPLLAHALHETWSQRADRHVMTVADYEAAGGFGRTVEAAAERVYEQLVVDDQALVKNIFLRLVHLEGEGVVTRRSVAYSELEGLEAGRDGADAGGRGSTEVVNQFVSARLLTAERTTVTIVHESLLAAWPRLSTWINEDREALRAHRRITDAAQQWAEEERDPNLLASGARLEVMRSSADHVSLRQRLSKVERDFLSASRAQEAQRERARRRQTRRLRTLVAVAAAFALVASVLVGVVNGARRDAARSRDEALSRQTALNAQQVAVTDPGLAAQLAVAGYSIAPTVEARSAVLSFADQPFASRHLGGEGPTAQAALPDGSVSAVSNAADGTVQLLTRRGGQVRDAGVIPAMEADASVRAVVLTPDGAVLFVGDGAGNVAAWDVTNPDEPRALGVQLDTPDGFVQQLAVSPTGDELMATGGDAGADRGLVARWDISDPAAPVELSPLPSSSPTWSVAYTDDGSHLAVSNETGRVEIWTLGATPERVAMIEPTDQPIFTVAFSPDGHMLATGSQDTRLRVWDVSTPTQPRAVDVADDQFDSWVNTVAFSRDGRYLLAGSSDQSVGVWSTEGSSWERVAVLPHPAEVTRALFVDDDRTIVTTTVEGTARWWDLATAMPLHVDGRAWGLAFDRTGDRFAMVSSSEARVWDTSSDSEQPTELSRVSLSDLDGATDLFSGAGTMSPDGRQLAIGSRETGEVYLVDVSRPGRPHLAAPPLGDAFELVESIAYRPDGAALAAGGDDNEVRIWSLDAEGAPTPTARIDDAADYVFSVAWSPDGRYLAVASSDSVVYLYDVADLDRPRLVAELDALETEAYMAMYSPDGTILATTGSDGIVVLWDVTDPAAPSRIGPSLSGPESRMFDLAFDSTSSYLAAVGADGETWLWSTDDMRAPTRLAVLGPAAGPLFQVEFDPVTGDLLATGSEGRLHRWPPDVDQVIDTICTSTGEAITQREWDLYLPDTTYDPPC